MRVGISGTPGTGKTTLARRVSDMTGISHVDVSSLAKEKGWVLAHDKARQTDIVDEIRVRAHVARYADVLIDAHYAELFECDIVFVVRCPPPTLMARLLARGYSREKVKENVMSEMVDACLVAAVEAVGKDRTYEVLQAAPDAMARAVTALIQRPDPSLSVLNRRTAHYLTTRNLDLLQRC